MLNDHFFRGKVKPPAFGSVSFMDCVFVNFLFFSPQLLNDVQVHVCCLEVSMLDADTPVGSSPKPRWLYISNEAPFCRLNCNMFLDNFLFPRLALCCLLEPGQKAVKKAVRKGSRRSEPASPRLNRLWQDLYVCNPMGEMTKCKIP